MIANEAVTGLIAMVIGYIFGSLPSAYLITRWRTGKDIRRMGGGNIGGLNTLREVGALPGLAVIILDLGKGAAAVAVAYRVLHLTNLSHPWVLLAGLASIVGHNWMVWLKFGGGRGMAATIGTAIMVFPLYGYPQGILLFLGVVVTPLVITHNVALSMSIGLISLPFIGWLGMKSGLFVLWSVVTGLIIGLKFLPTARTAWTESASKKDFIFERRGKNKR